MLSVDSIVNAENDDNAEKGKKYQTILQIKASPISWF